MIHPQIARFCEIAKAGRHPAASTGERTAFRLVKALHEIGDDIALLDGDTLAGFLGLVYAASGPWDTDAQKNAVYQILTDIVS